MNAARGEVGIESPNEPSDKQQRVVLGKDEGGEKKAI